MGETQKIVTVFLQAQSTLNSLFQCLDALVQWVKLLFLRVEKYTLEPSQKEPNPDLASLGLVLLFLFLPHKRL